jgi:hypothetical protein
MSAEGRSLEIALLCSLLGCGTAAQAAEEELPDMEFLEYLGSWEESDEDWLLFNELTGDAAREQEDDNDSQLPDAAGDDGKAGKKSTESDG